MEGGKVLRHVTREEKMSGRNIISGIMMSRGKCRDLHCIRLCHNHDSRNTDALDQSAVHAKVARRQIASVHF